MRPSPRPKTLIAVALATLALGGCGRRGSLQPPGAAAGAAAPRESTRGAPSAPASARGLPRSVSAGSADAPLDPDAVRDGDELSAVAVAPGTDAAAPVQTARGAKRGYVVPKQPFLLDPIL